LLFFRWIAVLPDRDRERHARFLFKRDLIEPDDTTSSHPPLDIGELVRESADERVIASAAAFERASSSQSVACEGDRASRSTPAPITDLHK
jgi:hypothetical protein